MNDHQRLPRVQILAVEADSGVHVRLQRGDQVVEARGPADEDLEAFARATLAALGQLLPDSVTVALEELHRVASPREVIVVILALRLGGVLLPHVGSALAGPDANLATVRAVLDALNRRLEVLGA